MNGKHLIQCTGVLLIAGAASGCLVRGRGYGYVGVPTRSMTVRANVVAPPPPSFNASISVAPVAVPQGVVVVQSHCQPGAPEQCNGLDDNCNGIIDEGCGYQGGNIQLTAAWNTASDIDLHVTDPNGEEVYYGHRNSGSGGVLDHDANAACSVSPPTVENVYWSSPTPPRGNYQARLVAYDMCSSGSTPTTLSISVGGRVVGVYQFQFTYDRQEFTIPFVVQ